MSLAETANLAIALNMTGNVPKQSAKFRTAMQNLRKDSEKARAAFGKIGQGIKTGFKRSMVIGAGAIGLLALNIRAGISSLVELENVQNATQQVLKTTHHVAGQTAKGIRDLSSALEDQTTVDDKIIQKGANLLLTFTNVRKNAFKPTLLAALDLNEALGKGPEGLNSTITMVGKALNDPIKGLSALSRVGVSFTQQQKDQITALVESGHRLKAQKIILRELNKEYGGRATTAAKGYQGRVNKLNDAVEDLQVALAGPLLTPLTKITTKLAEFAQSDDVKKGIRTLGNTIAGMFSDENIEKGADAVKGALGFLKDLPWTTINEGFAKTAEIAKTALGIFNSLPPEVKGALITLLAANKLTGGLVASGLKDLVGLALSSLKTITAGNVTVIGANVTGPGGGLPGGGAIPPGGKGGGGIGGVGGALIVGGATGGAITLATDKLRGMLQTTQVIEGLAATSHLSASDIVTLSQAGASGGIPAIRAALVTILMKRARPLPPVSNTPSIFERIGAAVFPGSGGAGPGGPGTGHKPGSNVRPRPTPGPSQGAIPVNLSDPNISDIIRPIEEVPRAIHGMQAIQQGDAVFQRNKLDALGAGIRASLASQQAALAGKLLALQVATTTHLSLAQIGIASAVTTSGSSVRGAITSHRPITNVYVATTVSATAVVSGTARAVATNRTRVS